MMSSWTVAQQCHCKNSSNHWQKCWRFFKTTTIKHRHDQIDLFRHPAAEKKNTLNVILLAFKVTQNAQKLMGSRNMAGFGIETCHVFTVHILSDTVHNGPGRCHVPPTLAHVFVKRVQNHTHVMVMHTKEKRSVRSVKPTLQNNHKRAHLAPSTPSKPTDHKRGLWRTPELPFLLSGYGSEWLVGLVVRD